MREFLIRLLLLAACTVIVKGALLLLGQRGIHPEQWVATMLGKAELLPLNAIAWILAGILGVVVVVAIQALHLDKRVASLVSRQFVSDQPPIGSLTFSRVRVEVFRNKTTGQTDVKIGFEIENTNDYMIKYDVSVINASINNKTVKNPKSPKMDSMGGYVYPGKTSLFRYEMIYNVDLTKMPISGNLEYDLTYSTVPPGTTRRSYKKMSFTLYQADVTGEIPVNHIKEIEE